MLEVSNTLVYPSAALVRHALCHEDVKRLSNTIIYTNIALILVHV